MPDKLHINESFSLLKDKTDEVQDKSKRKEDLARFLILEAGASWLHSAAELRNEDNGDRQKNRD